MELLQGMDYENVEGINIVFYYGPNPRGEYEVSAFVIKENPGIYGLESKIIDDPEILMDREGIVREVGDYKKRCITAIRSNPDLFK